MALYFLLLKHKENFCKALVDAFIKFKNFIIVFFFAFKTLKEFFVKALVGVHSSSFKSLKRDPKMRKI
jgi:hypothetical protein